MRKPSGNLPIVCLMMIRPFTAALNTLQIDSKGLLEAVGLPSSLPVPADLFVSPNSLYRFANLSATVAGDPHFGARAGYGLDLKDLPQITAASKSVLTVADYLIRIAINTEQHSTFARVGLQVETNHSTFNIVRQFKPEVLPSHIDGFYIGVLINVLKSALPPRWTPEQVRARVCDTNAIPPDLDGLTVLQSDGTIVSLTFPSSWLFEWIDTTFRVQASGFTENMPAPPATLIDAVKNALRPHIHEADLTVERGAEICGLEKRRLSRHLKAKGTTLAKLTASIREEEAVKELSSTNRKIGEFALSVGF